MSFNISGWAIRNPIFPVVLFVVLALLGVFSFGKLPITRFPNIDVPIITVSVTQSGAAPAELETQVTKKIEDAVVGVAGVKHVTSAISDGSSVSTIEFRLETNSDRALNNVKDAISRIRSDLPRSIDEPVVQRIEVAGLPIVTYAVSAPASTIEDLSWFVDDVVAGSLQGVKGVGGVTRLGGVDREIRISLDPDRLAALGVTAGDVNRQVRAINVDLAGGRGELSEREQSIRTLAGARKVEDLAATMISLPGGRKAQLADLGSVTDGPAEPRRFARLDGKPVVAFAVTRATGASDVTVAEALEQKLDTIRKARPDVAIELIDSFVTFTQGNFEAAMHTLVEGALLSVLVVLIFLRDWRATLITAIALPLSAVPTFWAMDAMGFSLNLVSLLALTLATGILVDDAIVEIENIIRHMRMGKSAWRASLEAADEIGLAVIAITMTIVAVFAPVSFMGGIAGQYFKQFGLTVALAVFFSLLVARLITPLMAAYFLKPSAAAHGGQDDGPVMRFYTRLVAASVRRRWLTLAAGVLIFVGSILSTKLLPSGFLPADDVARLLLAVELPPGSRLADTERVTNEIAARLRERPDVLSVFAEGGRNGQGPAEVRKALLTVHLTHKSKRNITQKAIEGQIGAVVAQWPDTRSWFINNDGIRAVSLTVSGADSATVANVAAELASQARSIPLLANVVSTAALDRPEIRIVPKSGRAADLGVSTEALAEAIRVATIGDIDANLAKFNTGERLLPIRVRLAQTARADLDALANLRVATSAGGAVPLASVADISFGQGPTSIERFDRVRKIALEADLAGNAPLGEALRAIYALPAAKNLPPGVVLRESGDAEVMVEVFQSFSQAMGAGLMMVLAVLVLLFGSITQPIAILLSLPLSIGGVICALFVTNKPVSLPVVIGILMLMGIVTKNAIMLIDFAVEQMAKGVDRTEAVVDAGRKRARPIVMTTIAMAAGMVPSALGLGDGGEFRSPMAIGVIGGLLASTVLSLVFVPAIFTFMDDIGQAAARAFGRLIGRRDEETEGVVEAKPARPPLSEAAE